MYIRVYLDFGFNFELWRDECGQYFSSLSIPLLAYIIGMVSIVPECGTIPTYINMYIHKYIVSTNLDFGY